MTEEAEQKMVAAELEQRRNQRILKEIEDRELEEAQAMLQEAEQRSKRKKKPVLDGEKMTTKVIMELALNEQLRERQEMEKKKAEVCQNNGLFGESEARRSSASY